MCLPASIAMSSALIDFGRPTNSGMTMCGKTTTSRNGNSGNVVRSVVRSGRSVAMEARAQDWIRLRVSPVQMGAAAGASSREPPSNTPPIRRLRMRRSHLGLLGEHQERLAVVGNGRLVDDDARQVRLRRQVVHHVEEHLLEDRAQAAGPGLSRQRAAGDRLQRLLADLQLDTFHPEYLVVLLDESVLGLDQDLDQRLLDALARHVARDRRVIALARDLVDLVDIDDAALRLLDIVVALLQQFLDDVLYVLADVTRLGKRRCIRDHEWDIEQARQRLRQQRLAGAGGPDQQDVALGELDIVFL